MNLPYKSDHNKKSRAIVLLKQRSIFFILTTNTNKIYFLSVSEQLVEGWYSRIKHSSRRVHFN